MRKDNSIQIGRYKPHDTHLLHSGMSKSSYGLLVESIPTKGTPPRSTYQSLTVGDNHSHPGISSRWGASLGRTSSIPPVVLSTVRSSGSTTRVETGCSKSGLSTLSSKKEVQNAGACWAQHHWYQRTEQPTVPPRSSVIWWVGRFTCS